MDGTLKKKEMCGSEQVIPIPSAITDYEDFKRQEWAQAFGIMRYASDFNEDDFYFPKRRKYTGGTFEPMEKPDSPVVAPTGNWSDHEQIRRGLEVCKWINEGGGKQGIPIPPSIKEYEELLRAKRIRRTQRLYFRDSWRRY